MKTCVIFCAAEFDSLLYPLSEEDYVIAADGGLRHTQDLGISPDEILGDFDSLGTIPQGATVFPVEKDDTDSMLAVRRGLSLGYTRFILYGSVDGPRLDHTVANFQVLQYLADHKARGILVGKACLVTLIQGETLCFPAELQGNVSVFALGGEATGVTLRGLYYSLENGSLTPGFPLGVSNHFTGDAATVTANSGSLLVIWDRQSPLPL